MLTDQFDMSSNSAVCEGEAIADLVLSLSTHFRRYNQLFVGMQSTIHELAKRCSERGRESEQRQSDTPLIANGMHHTNKRNVCGVAKQATPYSLPSHRNKRAGTSTAPAAKRPLSDFNFFCRDARKLVVEAHPEYTKEQVNKELGRIWSSLDSSSRQHYRQMYVQDKQRYSQDVSALAERTKCGIGPTSLAGAVQTTGSAHVLGANSQARQTIWQHASAHNTLTGGMAPGSSIDAELKTEPKAEAKSRIEGSVGVKGRSGSLQSILNCSPSTLGTVDDPEDADEPLVHTLFTF
ncbi:high mobility group [Coemansia sp. RSA 1933]|nr:high mobility group [Coemansia sp. RSA 1933]